MSDLHNKIIDVIKKPEYWNNHNIQNFLESEFRELKVRLRDEHKAVYFAASFLGITDKGYANQTKIIDNAKKILEAITGRSKVNISENIFKDLWKIGLISPVEYFYMDPEFIDTAQGQRRGSQRCWIAVHPSAVELVNMLKHRDQITLGNVVFKDIKPTPSPYLPENNYWFRLGGSYTIETKTFYRFIYLFVLSFIVCSVDDKEVQEIKVRSFTRTSRVEVELGEILKSIRDELSPDLNAKYYDETKFEGTENEELLKSLSETNKKWLLEIKRKNEPHKVLIGGEINPFKELDDGEPKNEREYSSTIYIQRKRIIHGIKKFFDSLDNMFE